MAALPGVRLAALIYEGEGDAEAALRVGRQSRAEAYRVADASDVADALWQIGQQSPIDVGIIANFGIILPEPALQLAKSGFVNFHPGLLPTQAGREPVRTAWETGETASGLTIHRATPRVDSGPTLFSLPYTIDHARSLDQNLQDIFRLGIPYLPRVISPS